MKRNTFWVLSLGFLTGGAAVLSLLALLSFSVVSGSPAGAAPGGDFVPVPAATAGVYVKNYVAGAVPVEAPVKGFTIDKAQYNAMMALDRENAALAGFRIYLGKNGEGRPVAIVVGVEGSGLDAVKNSVFSTDSWKTGPCPPVCDVASPINTEN